MGKLFDLSSFKNLFAKLKKIKHIEIYAVIILAILVVVICFYPSNDKKTTQTMASQTTLNADLYAQNIESRLKKVLSAISGAGEVECMVTLDGEVELVLAYSNDEKNSSTQNTTSSGTVNKTESQNSNKEPILINVNGTTQPLVLSEILPSIKGVVVVAQGASDVRVKLDILKAVQALLGVESSKIEIFSK